MKTVDHYEEELLERIGKKNPYRVPEGYFDTLPDRVMSRISHKKRKKHSLRWSVAAVFAGGILCAGLTLFKRDLGLSTPENDAPYIVNAEHMEDILDCNLVSNLEIETYLTEAE